MKVLVATIPQAGHFNPILPLVGALREAGDEVVFAVSPDYGVRAERLGFPSEPVGPEFDRWFAELSHRCGGEPGAGLPPDRILQWFVPHLFAEVGTDLTEDDLRAVIEKREPDLVLHDPYLFAAPLAAAAAGIPHVTHTPGPMPTIDVFEKANDSLVSRWRERGLPAPNLGGVFDTACIAICPRSLEAHLPAEITERFWYLRPVGFDGGSQAVERPDWLEGPPGRGTVYGTLGTHMNTDDTVFRSILDGLADEDLDVILTIGENRDPSSLNPVPPNARVERFVPQSFLFDRLSCVISHAGAGTVLPSLARSIPQVLVPQGADNFLIAECCTRAGVGITLMPEEVSAAALRDAVRRVIDEPGFSSHSGRIGAEIAAMPTPEQVAERLRNLPV